MPASDYVDEATAVLGGEDSDFLVKGIPGTKEAPYAIGLFCRAHDVLTGIYSIGEMELWELITDAREHWETAHAEEAHDRAGEAWYEATYGQGGTS